MAAYECLFQIGGNGLSAAQICFSMKAQVKVHGISRNL